jgi:four helix bundle suffix protein
MIQAARSGTRNIGEGSQTSGTSKQSELRLLDVARASLAELLDDYRAFLRQNNLPQWDKDDPRALAVRKLAHKTDRSYKTYMSYLSYAESAANCLICLINQTAYLLDNQIKNLGRELLARGDLKDRLKEEKKKEWFGLNEDLDELLKKQGLRRLEDGRVVAIDEWDP